MVLGSIRYRIVSVMTSYFVFGTQVGGGGHIRLLLTAASREDSAMATNPKIADSAKNRPQ